MFDDGAKMMLFFAGVAAVVLSMAAEQTAPREALNTDVNTARLPALPLAADLASGPAQAAVPSQSVALGDGFEAELLYGYVLEGRVVTRREFRTDATSSISPLDLGIVWGDLAEPDGIQHFEFSALPRALGYRVQAGTRLTDAMEEQITNNHLIPADQSINDALMAVDVGSRIRLSGYLVEVTGENISRWRSSTRRDDATIIGGCEIILVTGVTVVEPGGEA